MGSKPTSKASTAKKASTASTNQEGKKAATKKAATKKAATKKAATKKAATKRAATKRAATKKAATKKAATKKAATPISELSASAEIDATVRELGGWRAETLALMRALIRDAVPDVVEEVKWRKPSNGMRGVPVWSHQGMICTGETYKDKIKLTFAKGAKVADPASLFNSSLEGNLRRAIDVREGDEVNEAAFQALIRAAAAANNTKG